MAEVVATLEKTKRIVFIDTYYPDFLKTLPSVHSIDSVARNYPFDLQAVMQRSFGTADAYSRHLRALGWHAVDFVVNHEPLQRLWAAEHGRAATGLAAIALDQIQWSEPDVVFCQDLSFFTLESLRWLASKYLLVGQCSCPMPPKSKVECFSVIFTSFPHYVQRFEYLGVKAFYVPLAFDEGLLNRVKTDTAERKRDVVFVGGVGRPSHWAAGMQTLNAVAMNIPTSEFYGYGVETLPALHPVREKHKGKAFGLDMYALLAQSKIALNRHGEVAGGYTNNLRTFESTGMGAMLLTEESKNLREFFTEKEAVSYSSPQDAVDKIRHYLAHDDERREIAWAGQARTLKDHTYSVRMKQVSEILQRHL